MLNYQRVLARFFFMVGAVGVMDLLHQLKRDIKNWIPKAATENAPTCRWFLHTIHTGWWFGTFLIFPYIYNYIYIYIENNHPNWLYDIFQRDWNHQPVIYDIYDYVMLWLDYLSFNADINGDIKIWWCWDTEKPGRVYWVTFLGTSPMEQWSRKKLRLDGEVLPLCGDAWRFLPSGKRLHNYGKSPFLMGKLTINGHFQ